MGYFGVNQEIFDRVLWASFPHIAKTNSQARSECFQIIIILIIIIKTYFNTVLFHNNNNNNQNIMIKGAIQYIKIVNYLQLIIYNN
jgi:hypothetical protein